VYKSSKLSLTIFGFVKRIGPYLDFWQNSPFRKFHPFTICSTEPCAFPRLGLFFWYTHREVLLDLPRLDHVSLAFCGVLSSSLISSDSVHVCRPFSSAFYKATFTANCFIIPLMNTACFRTNSLTCTSCRGFRTAAFWYNFFQGSLTSFYTADPISDIIRENSGR